jgi:peptide methionine sulfoxide reductase msrA/msrB
MRIEDRSKVSHLSLWIGVLAVLAVGYGAYWYFSQSVPERDPSGKVYLKRVPSDAKLRSMLSDAQYHVTRENGTETAFQNQYWDNFRPGIYVDVITGEPLFSSQDKFNGNTGRPTFTKPISPDKVIEKRDTSFNMDRIEVRGAKSDAHLGHVFNDGPPPTGKRYAVNSAALKFIPVDRMEAEGYSEFLPQATKSEIADQPPVGSK